MESKPMTTPTRVLRLSAHIEFPITGADWFAQHDSREEAYEKLNPIVKTLHDLGVSVETVEVPIGDAAKSEPEPVKERKPRRTAAQIEAERPAAIRQETEAEGLAQAAE
jgi:hypothetical protein